MNKYDFKNLTPFKWCVIQNFPFIEEDFDAITNYQLLCKVVEYLNKTILSTNELGEEVETISANFIQLKNYVDTYFNNLDVQDEINNKLDIMAQDGTLANIINNEIFNTLQPKLTELVVFGDSWSAQTVPENSWFSNVANITHLNLTNYAISGAGFVNPSNNLISTQVNNFINSNIEKSKVKYIIFFGGINDYRNSTTANDLANAINNEVNKLINICENAKIVYISNTEYPYSMEQSYYWQRVHSYISTVCKIVSYNLDGQIGIDLFDNNLFHLNEVGQKWLTKNILAILNGGELFTYSDVRDVEDDYIKLRITCYRIKDLIFIIFKFKVKQAFTNHTLNFADNFIPLSWVNSTEVGSMVCDLINTGYSIRRNNFVVSATSELPLKSFDGNIILPIVENVNL